MTIPQLYNGRWQIELCFKWVKNVAPPASDSCQTALNYLRTKVFYGTPGNAVKSQIWIAISIYVLLAILKPQTLWAS